LVPPKAGEDFEFKKGDKAFAGGTKVDLQSACSSGSMCTVSTPAGATMNLPFAALGRDLKFSAGDRVQVNSRAGTVDADCSSAGTATCTVTFDDKSSSGPIPTVSVSLIDAKEFEAGEEVAVGSRRGIVAKDCSDAKCQVVFFDGTLTVNNAAMTPLESWTKGEVVVVDGQVGNIMDKCNRKTGCDVMVSSGSGAILRGVATSDIRLIASMGRGQAVTVGERPGALAAACSASQVCQVESATLPSAGRPSRR